jgi:DNA-directed RNA polymerase specialized sigma24 family protein
MSASADEAVCAAVAGEASAWDRLVDENLATVWAVLLEEGLDERDSADICEVVWLRLAQSLPRFHSHEDVRRWLTAVSTVEARRFLRRRAAEAERAHLQVDNVIRLAPGFTPSAVTSSRPIITA